MEPLAFDVALTALSIQPRSLIKDDTCILTFKRQPHHDLASILLERGAYVTKA